MDFIQADLDALNAAIKTGARKVKYADKEVEYRDLSEMLSVRKLIMDDLGLTSPASSRVFSTFSKGFE